MTESRQNTYVIIDGIFLQRAIDITTETYTNLKPGITFNKPDLITVIKHILDWYDKSKSRKKTIQCHVWLSDAFDLESRVSVSSAKSSFKTKEGNQVRILIENASIVGPELLDQLVTLVQSGDVILVADDRIYEPTLDKLFDEDYTVTVIMLNERDGSEMMTSFDWGDIMYPLGMALGMKRTEL